jgi:hypothetical protein
MSIKVFAALLAGWIGAAQAANTPGASAASPEAPASTATTSATTSATSTVSATAGNDWLMLVATNSTDAAREAEFNAWYDDIDIPDVLEVPGYQRARRGLRLGTAAAPVSALPADEGRYVALYDIASGNIDKTIIDMLMATRKMEARGRTTDLLKVTERVYYLRLAPAVEHATSSTHDTPGPAGTATTNEYVYVERFECCNDAAAERHFNDWYDRQHVAGVLASAGFERATRYELYRVLMIEPKTASRYLTIYELRAGTPEEAVQRMEAARASLRDAPGQSSFAESGSAMFRKIRDVRRP